MDNFLKILRAIILIIGLCLFMPFISFWVSYFGGWICKITIGNTLVKALNILFNTAYFTKDMIPWIAGALGWIGGYFKTINSSKSKSK